MNTYSDHNHNDPSYNPSVKGFSARQFREAMGPGYQVPMPIDQQVLHRTKAQPSIAIPTVVTPTVEVLTVEVLTVDKSTAKVPLQNLWSKARHFSQIRQRIRSVLWRLFTPVVDREAVLKLAHRHPNRYLNNLGRGERLGCDS